MCEHPELFITTTHGMRGWFAVLMEHNGTFADPVNTGIGSYKTRDEAKAKAREWAEVEGLEYRD